MGSAMSSAIHNRSKNGGLPGLPRQAVCLLFCRTSSRYPGLNRACSIPTWRCIPREHRDSTAKSSDDMRLNSPP